MKKRKSPNTAEKSNAKVNTARGLASISLFVYLFDKLSDVIYNALIKGFFGYLFSSYSLSSESFQNGYVVDYFNGEKKNRKLIRRIREYLSGSFENSFILKNIRRKICSLAFIPLKSYGSYFLSFGVYTVLAYFTKLLLPVMGKADADYLFVGIAVFIIAVPMNVSKLTLAKAVQSGRITGAIFIDAFGYRNESFNGVATKKSKRGGASVLLGIATGVFTFVVHPISILLFLFMCIAIVLIMYAPEIGVLICLFGLPFFSFLENPTLALLAFVFVTFISYVVKLIRGKRIFKIELMDFSVVFFLILIYLSGAISVGGRDSLASASIACILGFIYFLIVNLIRTEKWLKRCLVAIVSSGTVVAFIGVGEYILGLSTNAWLDVDYFSSIYGRTTSLFENPNYLAAYLAVIFPFALYQLVSCKTKRSRTLCIISCIIIALCTVFTWARAAWLAIIICTTAFFLFYSRKTMRAIFGAVIALPFLPFVLPDNVVKRFMSIGDMADSSTLYRVYTWKGCAEMLKEHFWGGIGYGNQAFSELYPMYAYAGIEAAVHSHNLYLQILITMGFSGLLCFGLIIFFYAQKSFEYSKSPVSRDSYLFVIAAFFSVCALLIMGMFDYVWYNSRIFFIFWAALALGIACIRIGKRQISKAEIYVDFHDSSSSVDLQM
ncbi:MAG: hypothetical protein E7577_02205 [Ruminococcaceae bacterium]|nr:hypothetical protein [Oscillospiraceae bacterium]